MLREQEVEKLQGEWPPLHITDPPVRPPANEDTSDGEHDPHALILNVSAVLDWSES